MDKPLLRIEHNYSPSFKGLDDLVLQLQSNFTIQKRPVWIPAASEGEEIWLQLFINSKAMEFLIAAIGGGILHDVIKVATREYVIKPLLEQFEHLGKINAHRPRIRAFKFEFDDITIKIYGLNRNHFAIVNLIFQNLFKIIPELNKRLDNISAINLPVFESEIDGRPKFQFDPFNEATDFASFLNIWHIVSSYGCNQHLYYLSDKKLIDHYGGIY